MKSPTTVAKRKTWTTGPKQRDWPHSNISESWNRRNVSWINCITALALRHCKEDSILLFICQYTHLLANSSNHTKAKESYSTSFCNSNTHVAGHLAKTPLMQSQLCLGSGPKACEQHLAVKHPFSLSYICFLTQNTWEQQSATVHHISLTQFKAWTQGVKTHENLRHRVITVIKIIQYSPLKNTSWCKTENIYPV